VLKETRQCRPASQPAGRLACRLLSEPNKGSCPGQLCLGRTQFQDTVKMIGSFCPGISSPHLHGQVYFTESLSEKISRIAVSRP